jgi:hypothetical protein
VRVFTLDDASIGAQARLKRVVGLLGLISSR